MVGAACLRRYQSSAENIPLQLLTPVIFFVCSMPVYGYAA